MKSRAPLKTAMALTIVLTLLTGFLSQAGEHGASMTQRYKNRLATLKPGESTPDDLKKAFADVLTPSLKQTKIKHGKKMEVWEIWQDTLNAEGRPLRDYLLFRFVEGKFVLAETVPHAAPPASPQFLAPYPSFSAGLRIPPAPPSPPMPVLGVNPR